MRLPLVCAIAAFAALLPLDGLAQTAVFNPSPPIAGQGFTVTLPVPPPGGVAHNVPGTPVVTVTGNVVQVRVTMNSFIGTGFPPPITVPVSPLAVGNYTLSYVTDNFFCGLGPACTPTGTTVVLTQAFSVVAPEPVPALSDAMTAVLAALLIGIAAYRLRASKSGA